MIWKAKNVMKSEPIWKKLDKETKYDLLGLSDKDREYIAIARQKRLERRAKKKGITINSDGLFVG
jgi:hypothetical protein